MPELPEVETIARKLRHAVLGRCVESVALSGHALRRPIASDFVVKLQGRTFRRIHRRGKYLIAELEPRLFLVVHLGMSGRIFFRQHGEEPAGHTHAVLRFSDGTALHYCDHRRFGLLAAHEVENIRDIPELQCLGRNPLGKGFSAEWLGGLLERSTQQIKSFLLDQRRIAGLGNIYVCEALFHARIHPGRRCHTLTSGESAMLVRAVRKVLKDAVRHRGTTFSDFMDSDGESGAHQNHLRVFQREGERCRRCRTGIARLRQGNRSSYYCPGCQK
jgi:formamidopyrimidine-DNA glycosylase